MGYDDEKVDVEDFRYIAEEGIRMGLAPTKVGSVTGQELSRRRHNVLNEVKGQLPQLVKQQNDDDLRRFADNFTTTSYCWPLCCFRSRSEAARPHPHDIEDPLDPRRENAFWAAAQRGIQKGGMDDAFVGNLIQSELNLRDSTTAKQDKARRKQEFMVQLEKRLVPMNDDMRKDFMDEYKTLFGLLAATLGAKQANEHSAFYSAQQAVKLGMKKHEINRIRDSATRKRNADIRGFKKAIGDAVYGRIERHVDEVVADLKSYGIEDEEIEGLVDAQKQAKRKSERGAQRKRDREKDREAERARGLRIKMGEDLIGGQFQLENF